MNYEALDEALEYIEEGLFGSNESDADMKKRLEGVCKFIEEMWPVYYPICKNSGVLNPDWAVKVSYGQPTEADKIAKKVNGSINKYRSFEMCNLTRVNDLNALAYSGKGKQLIDNFCNQYNYNCSIVTISGNGSTSYKLAFKLKK